MPGASASSVDFEMSRIRELSKSGKYREALAAAEGLAAAAPDNRDVLYLIAANQRCLNRISEALATSFRLEQQHPQFSLLFQERGYCYVNLRDFRHAIDAFQRGVEINPALTTSWIMLERLYRITGELENAAAAAGHVSRLKQLPPEVVRAGSLFSDGELSTAESILRAYLLNDSNHVEALRLLARVEHKLDFLDDAETRLEAILKIAPNYRAARLDYVRVLIDRQKYLQASEEIGALLKLEPENKEYLLLSATAFAGLGEHDSAIALYRELIAASPHSPVLHLLLGHSYKAVGRQQNATRSYQSAAVAQPNFGDAWWSLANLKTYRFSNDEIARLRAEEAASASRLVDRYHLCFALGKALEDRGDFAESWQFYERGNKLKRAESRYRPEISEVNTRQQIDLCTAPFFAVRAGLGVPDPDPIFIVGLPRSGSTLVEQILASHSKVEGTQELPDIQRIVLQLSGRRSDPDYPRYPAVLAELTPDDFRSLGERYLTGTRAHRKQKPFFIDKMPNNFRHIGLIHLVLPNAKIIDVRREPMACCFSNLKQLFARAQEFTYSIEDIARYYRTYLHLMRHWDAVLSGRVLRVCYEDIVEDLESSVRRILEFCSLKFESSCFEFHKTERSVNTASSEQVRQPIFRESLSQWRNYEPWLGPLKLALGDALVLYRE
jgi:tetratricopeptide (TPR) repeat protein